MMNRFFCLLYLLLPLYAQEDLISTMVPARNGKEQSLRMWIPPETEVVRGAIIQGRWNGLVNRGQYRQLARMWDFALIGGMMEHGDAYETSIPLALKDLAEKSGHPEIEHVPFITMGFSNGGWWAVNVARVLPERTIAVAVCAMPGLSGAGHHPEYRAAMQRVPVMQVNGASDGATHDWMRKEDPTFPKLRKHELPWSLALQWNTKHKYGATNSLAFPFLQEAIRLRLPEDADAREGPPQLRPIDPDAVWMGDSRTWRSRYAEIAPATEDGLQDPKQVWLLNENVAFHWRAFQSIHLLPQQVSVEVTEEQGLLLNLDGDIQGIESITFFHGAQVLGTADEGTSIEIQDLEPGVYSIHAELIFDNSTKKVTSPALYLKSK